MQKLVDIFQIAVYSTMITVLIYAAAELSSFLKKTDAEITQEKKRSEALLNQHYKAMEEHQKIIEKLYSN